MENKHSISYLSFLKDVFICSLGAYGGPEAHISVFLNQLVTRRKYLSEAELIELVALCSILPGPTSTQTIVAVGYKTGGPRLALLTMAVWALPVLVVMTALSFLYSVLSSLNISNDFLKYIGPMAVGFIAVAAVRISRKVVTNLHTALLMAAALGVTVFYRSPWVFPALLAAGGVISILLNRRPGMLNSVRLDPPWHYLALFALFAAGSLAVAVLTGARLALLFESFYRYGYLVFGGGQVVVPLMQSELVEIRQYMSNEQFLTGYGLVQGLPGPMFSFAAYAGGMAARGQGVMFQLAGAIAGGIGIFLPGILLIFFVFPVWEDLKKIDAIRIALKGVNAVAGGLITSAAVIIMLSGSLSFENITAVAASALLLYFTKIPATLIVALSLAAGFVF